MEKNTNNDGETSNIESDSQKNDDKTSMPMGAIGAGSIQSVQDEESPKIITDEKLKCYEKFNNIPVIIEGPEQSQDFSYFL